MKKQTAIQYLAEKLKDIAVSNFDFAEHHTEILISTTEFESLIQQALKMEKEQHKDTWDDGVYGDFRTFDDYYNQTLPQPNRSRS
jgi:hypothetical protein